MESINNLIIRLIAIENFCKDIHYNSKGDSFYSKHLLADRIQENLSDYLDQIKEVCILGSDEKTLPSGEYLSRATSLIPVIEKSDKENFKKLENLIIDTLALLEGMEDSTKGEENLYGAIAQDLQQSIGLIYRQVEN